MIADRDDVRPRARCSLHEFAHQYEIGFVVQARIAGGVHQLDSEIDAFGWRIGLLGGHDVFFAQDRGVALDQEPRALTAVGDEAIAKNEALAGLQLNFETHLVPLLAAAF